MNSPIKAYAAFGKGQPLKPYEYDAGPLKSEQVEIKVSHCGICHSDLSMLDNDWGFSSYPMVAGHEVVGTVTATGPTAKRVKVGDRVGLGWHSGSCMSCAQCLAGDHNLCLVGEATIVGRHGGFADRVRCNWEWATPIPDAMQSESAGPLFCGGLTVFNPLLQYGLRPTDRVGVVGIGGLGHLALQFLNKWGCEVVAFTSSESKRDEAMKLGAHRAVSSVDTDQLKQLAGSLDFILVTSNVTLPWELFIGALAPRGRLHLVGAVLEPVPVGAFSLIMGQKSVSGSPVGSPSTAARMMAFCARHSIAPIIEKFPMSRINDALERLRSGKARYRVVLENDLN
jgi:uncharacterized zinc-type alcohol dehydrogenase-like protein